MSKMLTIPTIKDDQLTVLKDRKYAIHFEMKSAGTSAIVNPNKSLICVVNIVSAIPLVKPMTMG